MRQFDVAILGARGVGKSALTDRFVTVRDVFVDKYDPTIGEQYHPSMVVDGEQDSFKFFFTTGVEQFTAFTEVYIKSCHGFVLVFSLTQEGSLKEVESLRKQIFRIKDSENVPIVVVGTKSDLVSEREVPTTTIETLASRWNLPFYETSAKRNWHINDIFEDLLRQMRVRYFPDAAKKAKKKATKKQPEGPCIIM
ncbi:P-loop containing nucleoside triphosphate hydrolase protein [Mycena albidolilacea]|uniref:P-loop containing nucleoside triphosphate hydrolase protein n=1 Tax=Mycena albidolilacea TaxID=1033008 RepID=A0AAD7EUN3_9AGAR|nr:P-loop containing nucleoside triphosphate hydrolase protein [Mycena albidolilacea]